MGSAIGHFFERHSELKAFIDKFMKDNVGMLASVVAWTLFTSIIPILAGLVAISGLFLHDQGAQRVVIMHLSAALQNVFTYKEIESTVRATVQHNGLLAIIGFAGVLWGGQTSAERFLLFSSLFSRCGAETIFRRSCSTLA